MTKPTKRIDRLNAKTAELGAEARAVRAELGRLRTLDSAVETAEAARLENTARGINPIRIELDALIPTAYRRYTRSEPADWPSLHSYRHLTTLRVQRVPSYRAEIVSSAKCFCRR